MRARVLKGTSNFTLSNRKNEFQNFEMEVTGTTTENRGFRPLGSSV